MSIYETIAARAQRSDIVFHVGKAAQLSLLNVKGAVSFRRARIISEYLDTHSVRKLQLGSGPRLLDGWLNTDCSLFFPAKCFLDVTKPFPLEDQTFDYVFSEHLIEHLTYAQGQSMLRECHRVLKPGGRIRVSCPDLRIILGLYNGEKSEAQDRYIKTMTDDFLPDVGVYEASFVINNAMRDWGHRFLYDEETLTLALESAGFVDVTRRELYDSDDPNLSGLESRGPEHESKCFETQVLEATKPTRERPTTA